MTEIFQIAVMSSPATERLKSSVRKAWQCPPRWRRWSTVEEPAFLMAAAMLLSSSSNGLNEGSTRWWSFISLLIVQSFWAEQAVNCLLKACAIAFEVECVFSRRRLRYLVGDSTSCRLAWAAETSSAWDWWRGRRIPRRFSTGLALPGN